MSLEEINKWLDNEYGISYTKLEELHDFYFEKYCDLQQENQELKKQLEDTNEELELVRCDLHNRTSERNGYYRNIEILENQQKEFIEYLENEIYSIEPKGTGVNYNCEYDSEEDYIKGMKEQSKLNTFKEILSKYREIIGGKE